MNKKKIDKTWVNYKKYFNRGFQLLGILFLIGAWEISKIDGPMSLLITIIWLATSIALYVLIPSIEWKGGKK